MFPLLIAFGSFVDLGSGVQIEVETGKYRATLLQTPKKKKIPKDYIPAMLPKEEAFTVEGETYKVERSLLRYEALADIVEDLPDFIQDILRNEN